MPKVSAIIPCYNHGAYLPETVDSVLAQTFQDLEIIIVNDGSTDPMTIRLLANHTWPRTRIVHIVNSGPAAARNAGVREALGEYILTIDSDDLYEPTFVEKGVNILDADPDVGFVTSGREYFGVVSKRVMPEGGGPECCLGGILPNAIYRKRCWDQVGGYDEKNLKHYEDWDFALGVAEQGWRIAVVPEYLFRYRTHLKSRRVSAHSKRIESLGNVLRKHRATFGAHVEEVVLRREHKILRLKREKADVLNSASYRIGHWILAPARMALRLLGRS